MAGKSYIQGPIPGILPGYRALVWPNPTTAISTSTPKSRVAGFFGGLDRIVRLGYFHDLYK